MKHLDIKQIQEIIPHRHPFLLLDYLHCLFVPRRKQILSLDYFYYIY